MCVSKDGLCSPVSSSTAHVIYYDASDGISLWLRANGLCGMLEGLLDAGVEDLADLTNVLDGMNINTSTTSSTPVNLVSSKLHSVYTCETERFSSRGCPRLFVLASASLANHNLHLQ